MTLRLAVMLPLLGLGCARPSPVTGSSAALSAARPATAQASRVYRDPSTGQLGEPPPGALPATAPAAARPALTEEPAAGGGRMIRLRGAFRSDFVARTDGKTTTASCVSNVDARCVPAADAP
jgi:hypothetical protein